MVSSEWRIICFQKVILTLHHYMRNNYALKIITHEKVVFDENVDEIYTKTTDGEMGILKITFQLCQHWTLV